MQSCGVRAERKVTLKQANPLETAAYIFVLTTVPASEMSIAQCLEIFRFRWQIELAFKNLKSVIGLTRMEAKSRDLCLAYISALLILAILVDRMTNEHVPFFPCG